MNARAALGYFILWVSGSTMTLCLSFLGSVALRAFGFGFTHEQTFWLAVFSGGAVAVAVGRAAIEFTEPKS